MESRRHVLLLCLLGLVFFLGNWRIPVSDPVEVNYTQTAVEMLSSGDFTSPRIYGHAWYDKPVFFYWELMAAFSVFGVTDFAARFFPSLFAVAGLFLAYFFGSRLYGERTGFRFAVVLGTSLIYWCLAKLIITDMTLFFFMSATLCFFYLAYRKKERNLYYAAYAFAGCAVLTKGPVGLVLPGFIILLFLAWQRDLRELGRMKLFSGLLVFLLVCSPWYFRMYALHGADFLDTFLGVHNYLRATVSEHPKWDVWYYYTGVFFLGTFPWSFCLPMALWRRWKARDLSLEQDTKFLLLWALVIHVFFQCMATKYPTYTFPAFFPVALLTARMLEGHGKLWKGTALAGLFLCLAVTGVLAARGSEDGHFAGKSIAECLNQRIREEDVLISLGDYRPTIVYYTQHPMYALDSKEAIEERSKKGISWTTKNVMPFMTYEDVPRDRDVYLVVEEHRAREFGNYFKEAEWELLCSATKKDEVLWLYYRPTKEERMGGE